MPEMTEEEKRKQQQLKEQNQQQRTKAQEAIEHANQLQSELRNTAKEKANEYFNKAEKLMRDPQTGAEALRIKLTQSSLSGYSLLEGALLECAGHLEQWNEAQKYYYLASLYNDPKWGPRLIQMGDFADKYLDPKNIPQLAEKLWDVSVGKGLDKFHQWRNDVKKDPTPQQIYFDYKFNDGKVEVDLDQAKVDPFGLVSKNEAILAKFHELNIPDNLQVMMDLALRAKGYEKNPADDKYYKLGDDLNLTDEVLTEDQFNDVADILKRNFCSKDHQFAQEFEDQTEVSIRPQF